MKKKRKNIPFIISSIIFFGALVCLILYIYSIKTDNDKIEVLRKTKELSDNTESKEELGYYLINGVVVQEGLKDIYLKNSDTVGWIKKDNTNIDYPVMYTPDDEQYYLHTGFDKKYSFGGCIFIGSGANIENPSNSIVIYGHHMIDKSMFTNIENYKEENYYKLNKTFTFDTLRQTGTYEVIAAFPTQIYPDDYEGFQYYKYGKNLSEDEFNEFRENINKLTLYKTTTQAEYGDQIIMLSTCAYHTLNGRFVVVAKRVKGLEVDLNKEPIKVINTEDK